LNLGNFYKESVFLLIPSYASMIDYERKQLLAESKRKMIQWSEKEVNDDDEKTFDIRNRSARGNKKF